LTALAQAADTFLAELDKWTPADLVKRRKPLVTAIAAMRKS